MFFASTMIIPTMCSATETLFAAGVYVTRMPFCEAAAKSMVSSPAPWRAITLNRGPASMISRSTFAFLHKKRVSVRYPSLQSVAVANREAANLEPL